MAKASERRVMELNRPFSDNYISKREGKGLKGGVNNPMTPAELKDRKKTQSRLSLAGSAAGLTGLGLIGTAAIARKKPGLFNIKPTENSTKIARHLNSLGGKATTPKQERANQIAGKIKDKGYIAGSIAGGIGGIGGLNFAAINRAEANKGKHGKVKKAYNAYTGTETNNYTPKRAKRSPKPDKNRERRQALYTPAATLGASGLVAGAGPIGSKYADKKAGKTVRLKNVVRTDTKALGNLDAKLKENLDNAPPANPHHTDRVGHANRTKWAAERRHLEIEQGKASDKLKASSESLNDLRGKRAKFKAKGKTAAFIGAGAVAAAGVGNEIHRHKSGKSYKGNFDHYKRD